MTDEKSTEEQSAGMSTDTDSQGSSDSSEERSEGAEGFRSGFVSIIGRPNVGKSTLLNRILGYKVSIVTPKPQTTRKRIIGILTGEGYQIVFIDTPGLHELKKKGIYEYMLQAAYRAASEADLIAYMTEADSDVEQDAPFLKRISTAKVPKFLLINKIDLVNKRELLPKIDAYSKSYQFDEIIPISALTGDGVDLFVKLIVKYLPEGPLYYPEDQITDQSVRFVVSEIIREKLFMLLKQELPYAVAVEVEEFKERSDKLIYIRATIIVEKDSQKFIVIGKSGSMLKKVGTLAREELEHMLGKKVFLELFVKVRRDWTKDPKMLGSLGFKNP